jgi:hypothetical protein
LCQEKSGNTAAGPKCVRMTKSYNIIPTFVHSYIHMCCKSIIIL